MYFTTTKTKLMKFFLSLFLLAGLLSFTPVPPNWQNNFEKAKQTAAAEHKYILLNFTITERNCHLFIWVQFKVETFSMTFDFWFKIKGLNSALSHNFIILTNIYCDLYILFVFCIYFWNKGYMIFNTICSTVIWYDFPKNFLPKIYSIIADAIKTVWIGFFSFSNYFTGAKCLISLKAPLNDEFILFYYFIILFLVWKIWILKNL